MNSDHRETVLQFGTGKFLRAFADLFLHEMNESGAAAQGVVAVQSTGCDRVRQLNAGGGRYHVAIRGLDEGRRVDRTVEVRSVCRALSAQGDWHGVLAVARSEGLALIVSNLDYDLNLLMPYEWREKTNVEIIIDPPAGFEPLSAWSPEGEDAITLDLKKKSSGLYVVTIPSLPVARAVIIEPEP